VTGPTLARFEHALAHHVRSDHPALPGRTNHLSAGVLIPIVWADSPYAIATVRSATLRHHANEVCFPGGRPDAADTDLLATALREAHEELGIRDARVLGELSSVPLYTSDYRLHPFVALVADDALAPNGDEVSEVLRFSLQEELEREAILAISWTAGHLEGLSPLFFSGEHIMYGATAHAFHELLHVAAEASGRNAPPLRESHYRWSDVLKSGG